LFLCADVKNKFKKIKNKNIILMYFQEKNTLKNNIYHILRHLVKYLKRFSELFIHIIKNLNVEVNNEKKNMSTMGRKSIPFFSCFLRIN
jgi:hypothetical protein